MNDLKQDKATIHEYATGQDGFGVTDHQAVGALARVVNDLLEDKATAGPYRTGQAAEAVTSHFPGQREGVVTGYFADQTAGPFKCADDNGLAKTTGRVLITPGTYNVLTMPLFGPGAREGVGWCIKKVPTSPERRKDAETLNKATTKAVSTSQERRTRKGLVDGENLFLFTSGDVEETRAAYLGLFNMRQAYGVYGGGGLVPFGPDYDLYTAAKRGDGSAAQAFITRRRAQDDEGYKVVTVQS